MIEHGMAKEGDIKTFGSKISEQAKRLIEIINDIIKLSEFDENKAESTTETFMLHELAENVAGALRENDKGVEVIIAGEQFELSANRRMIDELLYNLIDNGIKYNKDGGSVTVALSRENGQCKIAVSDTGIGIPAEHHNRLFERFYRVDKSRSKKTGGTGLGLSIVKHIAEHHGGRVEIESADGVGTTVICWLAGLA
jgi:two-component system phosphate regulon sensor histidine kinase PhoR